MEKSGKQFGSVRNTQKKMMVAAGAQVVILNGCIGKGGCCSHVFGPTDKRVRCPQCDHLRCNGETGRPNEMVYHFPLLPRLKALLRTQYFLKLLQVCMYDMFTYHT